MSDPNDNPDYDFYTLHAAIEREAAKDCVDPRVAAIHLEMAVQYDAMAAIAAARRDLD